ncbi:MAG: CsgG/HfaB family protein [Tannerella sp.]|jgi:hypothetical protein|nr:CsgG/HfaB family protein [Tannerella sp.]
MKLRENSKHGRNLYLSAIMLFFSLLFQAQEDRKVAVFDPEGKVDTILLEIVREEISSAIVNTQGYTVLERQLINKVLEENKFQASGLVSDTQVSDVGKLMGADYVVVTSISALGGNYYLSCKMIEVATARIEKQFTGTTTDGMNDIPQTAQFVVKRMFGENVKQPIAVKQNTVKQQQKTAIDMKSTEVDSDDGMELLVMLKKSKEIFYEYKEGDVVWFDFTSASWYIAKGLARPYNPDNDKTYSSPVNKKVLIVFTSSKDVRNPFGRTIYKKGDWVWLNDDLGRLFVVKNLALFKDDFLKISPP